MGNKRYGLCYQGSKNRIAEWVVEHLPHTKNFYDLFCGGGAITHCAMLSGKYKNFTMNDLNPLCLCFEQAANGEFSDEELDRWISREEYKETRLTNPIAFFCYSFGGNGTEYCYSKEIEPFKRALHKARVYGDEAELRQMGCPSSSRKWIYDHNEQVKANYIDWYLSNVMHSDLKYSTFKDKINIQVKQRQEELRQYLVDAFKASGLKSQREVGLRLGTNMERHYFGKSQWELPTEEMYAKMQTFMPLSRPYCELFGLNGCTDLSILLNLHKMSSFYSLESYSNINRLRGLRGLRGSYDAVEIEPNSVIYCDIPYRNTAAYENVVAFDYDKFYDWALRQKELTIISEYTMPEPDFIPIAAVKIFAQMQGGSGKETTEKLFIPRRQWDIYKCKSGRLF